MDGAAHLRLHLARSVPEDPRVKHKLLLHLMKDNALHLQLHGVKVASVRFMMKNIVRMCPEKRLQQTAKRDKDGKSRKRSRFTCLDGK